MTRFFKDVQQANVHRQVSKGKLKRNCLKIVVGFRYCCSFFLDANFRHLPPKPTALGDHTRGVVLPVRVVHRRRGVVRGGIRARDEGKDSGGDEGALLGEEERRRKSP